MLFKRSDLEATRAGRLSLAFRFWRRPTVRAGGRLRTRIGELAIDSVDIVRPETITDTEARRAGCADADRLRTRLTAPGDRWLYRIVLRWDGDDPRIARRADDRPDPAERDRIAATLDRMARSGPPSATPRKVLSLIETHPGRRAVDLAAIAGMETPAFKWRVRRLKELGLTESLDTGYRLSARGQSVLPLLGSA